MWWPCETSTTSAYHLLLLSFSTALTVLNESFADFYLYSGPLSKRQISSGGVHLLRRCSILLSVVDRSKYLLPAMPKLISVGY